LSEQTQQKKSRFQISRECQDEFVKSIAQSMLELGSRGEKWKPGWSGEQAMGMPFCPVTGREYSGANLIKLMLTAILKEYKDDRWLTFKQLKGLQAKNPDSNICIRKGERGTQILRPEEIAYIIEEDGTWTFLSKEEQKRLKEQRLSGEITPQVHTKLLFYPHTVFNVSQIDNFPAKQEETVPMKPIERHQFIENFIASSGVAVEHYLGDPCFRIEENVVKLPHLTKFHSTDEYYAAKLHEFFHATGHETRERRELKTTQSLKSYAFEEVRAEMFSMLAGAYLNLPMPEVNSAAYIENWNKIYSGGESRAVLQAASEAAKILSVLRQYERGEQPSPQWFPDSDLWPDLIRTQKDRDAASAVSYEYHDNSQFFTKTVKPLSVAEAAKKFLESNNPVTQARTILNTPSFLDAALKMDPESAIKLTDLLGSMATTIRMEMDRKQEESSGMSCGPR